MYFASLYTLSCPLLLFAIVLVESESTLACILKGSGGYVGNMLKDTPCFPRASLPKTNHSISTRNSYRTIGEPLFTIFASLA